MIVITTAGKRSRPAPGQRPPAEGSKDNAPVSQNVNSGIENCTENKKKNLVKCQREELAFKLALNMIIICHHT